LGNVDIKLGLIMVIGTIFGVETGAQIIQQLKRHANVDIVVAIAFVIVLVGISTFIGWESWQTIKMRHNERAGKTPAKRKLKQDESAIAHIAKQLHRFHLPPMISLPHSGIERISLWAILLVAYVGGVFSGFLGGGAGYIRMPAMVYLLGVPTHVAVGTTSLKSSSLQLRTFTHAIKGNVDIMIALVMHTGGAIGRRSARR